jgi:hypothetical protein
MCLIHRTCRGPPVLRQHGNRQNSLLNSLLAGITVRNGLGPPPQSLGHRPLSTQTPEIPEYRRELPVTVPWRSTGAAAGCRFLDCRSPPGGRRSGSRHACGRSTPGCAGHPCDAFRKRRVDLCHPHFSVSTAEAFTSPSIGHHRLIPGLWHAASPRKSITGKPQRRVEWRPFFLCQVHVAPAAGKSKELGPFNISVR